MSYRPRSPRSPSVSVSDRRLVNADRPDVAELGTCRTGARSKIARPVGEHWHRPAGIAMLPGCLMEDGGRTAGELGTAEQAIVPELPFLSVEMERITEPTEDPDEYTRYDLPHAFAARSRSGSSAEEPLSNSRAEANEQDQSK